MKPNLDPTKKKGEAPAGCVTQTPPPVNQSEAAAPADVPQHFRRLKPGEVVGRGDFVANEQRGLEPWEGPGGFHAGAFVRPIYRRDASRPSRAKKSK